MSLAVACVRVALLAALAVAAAGCSRDTAASGTTGGRGEHPGAGYRGKSPQRGPAAEGTASGIEFEPRQMDFGILPPGASVTGHSVLWNTGTTPRRIVRSITSCGCTAADADLVDRVIAPGGFTTFSTTMNMKSGLGEKMEKITIFFDDGTFTVQFYTAEVSLPVRVVPPYIAASQRQRDGSWEHTMTGELEVTSTDGTPFRITATHGGQPDVVGWDPAVDPARTSYTLRWDLTPFAGGPVPWYWVIETDRADCPLVDVRVRHATTLPPKPRGRPWVPKDLRVLAGEIANGVPFEISTTIEYSGNAVPQTERAGAFSQTDALEVGEVEVQAEGKQLHYRISLTPRAAQPGLFYEQVTVYASGGSAQLRIIGRVAP